MKELWSEDSTDQGVNMNSLKCTIQKFAPCFIGNAQQDAQEFMRSLLLSLHEDINKVIEKSDSEFTDIVEIVDVNEKALESWSRFLKVENSEIVNNFNLSLPIPQRTRQLSLFQCLDSFTREESLDGEDKPTCSKCKERRKCTKSLSIQRFPEILVFHLKRFSLDLFVEKLNVTVDFPLEKLDMSYYAADGSVPFHYDLYAISNHSGTINSEMFALAALAGIRTDTLLRPPRRYASDEYSAKRQETSGCQTSLGKIEGLAYEKFVRPPSVSSDLTDDGWTKEANSSDSGWDDTSCHIQASGSEERAGNVHDPDVSLVENMNPADVTLVETLPVVVQSNQISDIMKMIVDLKSICQITLNKVNAIVEQSLDRQRNVSVSDEMIKSFLPLITMDSLLNFEDLLKTNDIAATQFMNKLFLVGGSDYKNSIRRCLQQIFDDDLAQNCSWTGQKQNFKISDMKIIDIFKHSSDKVSSDVDLDVDHDSDNNLWWNKEVPAQNTCDATSSTNERVLG
ncbi:unnamed protein product [Phaedon cochleariae]|uniref:ubiquitinyl hydrolase 1 n=1 Tax=Phaedon cochleariae TaxID=80249 RepID=A0A9N9X0Q1_PHACE|nr:unnamed protein product [Phaedon cochleariae]